MSSDVTRTDAVDADVVVAVERAGKCYELYARPLDRLKQTLWRGRRQFFREFWALRDVSFELRRGESLGVVGRNGSGKSTLLQLIAGTLRPTTGSVRLQGRVAALLELGSGFNHEFTGRENVFLNGAILGLSEREVRRRFDEIADFADIGDFMDQPVKTYSTGMVVRLAFAVQVLLDPDVLIVDEALAVGDALFQAKCFRRIEELRCRGVTILLATHDLISLQTVCQHAILLDRGEVVLRDASKVVAAEYYRRTQETEWLEMTHLPAEAPAARAEGNGLLPPAGGAGRRTGNGSAEVFGYGIYDHEGRPTRMLTARAHFRFDLGLRFHQALHNPHAGVALCDAQGRCLLGGHTMYEGVRLGPVRAGDEFVVSFGLAALLNPGKYLLMFGVADHPSFATWTDCDVYFDFCEIDVVGTERSWGMVNAPVETHVRRVR